MISQGTAMLLAGLAALSAIIAAIIVFTNRSKLQAHK
jgi:hypothetical protein